ncbi:MAG: tRNA lysidine(34) synthetase TilS [Bacteroidales bacterium]|nr:tRNA lysidine(34) synthetase TilS [Bacteroidales bacterium]
MLDRFQDFIREHNLGRQDQEVLLTISGGIDSVTMLDLYRQTGIPYAIAHCNFGLRGEESDGDEAFVRQLAAAHQCRLFVQSFDTKAYCGEKNISIQMGARELRYGWFEELAVREGFDLIATAHNRNDVAETMLLNLIRGTGLKGLTGMAPLKGKIIRPLLFASREEITGYVQANRLSYREDSSNSDIKYQRNLIRNKIIPEMETINPSVVDTLIQESRIFDSSYKIYHQRIEQLRQALNEPDGQISRFSIAKILSLRLTPTLLFDVLQPYGLSFSDISDILGSLTGEAGKLFYTDGYVILKDRNYLIIEERNKPEHEEMFTITPESKALERPFRMKILHSRKDDTFRLPTDNMTVALDAEKLCFPLKLRHWKEGDYFFPLGMKGRKKLSDFFTDKKINLLQKNRIWILESAEEIVWIVGMQIDDRYKVSPQTKKMITLSLID